MFDNHSKQERWRWGCWVLLAVMLIVWLVHMARVDNYCRAFRERGVQLQARIVARSTGVDYSEFGGDILYVTYEYEVENVMYNRKVENDTLYTNFETNKVASVAYNPDNPSESILMSGDPDCNEYR